MALTCPIRPVEVDSKVSMIMEPPSQLSTVVPSPVRVLVCPSGFKESLTPQDAADCIETGLLRALPSLNVTKLPLVDGGEDFAKVLSENSGGHLISVTVCGPVRHDVTSHFGILGNADVNTAVIDMASAAGLRLVPHDQRNPLHTTTYGVGQLIKAALDHGVQRILIGLGDSGTCDGGIGLCQALGARFYDEEGKLIPKACGGKRLARLSNVDLGGLDARLKDVTIDVACNWHNVLCGSHGVARVFGPQKGASPEDVLRLEMSMGKVAEVVSRAVGRDIATSPGTGASGGVGAALLLIGATLRPRFDVIGQFLNIEKNVREADLVITAEGGIDEQTPHGKIPAEVARIARKTGTPVLALAGTVGRGASHSLHEAGIGAWTSILTRPMTLKTAIDEAERLLEDASESVMRMVLIGQALRVSVAIMATS